MWIIVGMGLVVAFVVMLFLLWVFRPDPIGTKIIALIKGDPRGWEETDLGCYAHSVSGLSLNRKSAGPFAYYKVTGQCKREIHRPLMVARIASALTWLQRWRLDERIDIESLGEGSLRKESRSVLAQVMADLDEHFEEPKPADGASGFADNGRGTKEGVVSQKRVGTLTGKCNREVCRAPNALWFNQSTQAYYCETCATALNRIHHADAQRLYNSDLCVKHEAEAALAQARVPEPQEAHAADEQRPRVAKKKVAKKARSRARPHE